MYINQLKVGDSLRVGSVLVTVQGITNRGGDPQVKLHFDAPQDVLILREELVGKHLTGGLAKRAEGRGGAKAT